MGGGAGRGWPLGEDMIEVISATRLTQEVFWQRSALGLSLRRLASDQRLVPRIAFENRRGLPEVFNERIAAAGGPDLLVFIHDDVWIDDFFLADRVIEGLGAYDLIGVAGNRRRLAGQPAWAFASRGPDGRFQWDEKTNLSGAIANGKTPFGRISHFGPAPQACELLDGVFLAARRATLRERSVRFDPAFDFDLYDQDFCRTARASGMRLGTWPIALTHQSGGAFGTERWTLRYRQYLEKWRD